MQTTATHPSTAQPSVVPAINVCLLMKWNCIAMGKKNNRSAIRVVCFPTYLICPCRSHCDILFPIDEPYVIRYPHSPFTHSFAHPISNFWGKTVKQGWAGAVKKINNTIWNVAPSTILFCFYLVPGYVVNTGFCYRKRAVIRPEYSRYNMNTGIRVMSVASVLQRYTFVNSEMYKVINRKELRSENCTRKNKRQKNK